MKRVFQGFMITLSLAFAIQGNAQDTIHRVIGISGTIQTTQFGIAIPIWAGSHTTISPAFDFQWGQKIGTDYGIGLVPRFYFSTKKLAPYLGLRGGLIHFTPAKENTSETATTDWVAGLEGGAEYFFDPRFSVGVEIQGNFTKSDKNSMRFGNPGNWNFNLATMVSANVYFLRK